MKKFAVLSVGIAIALVASGVFAQPAEPTKVKDEPARDQRWLKQLVGEWDTEWKLHMQPDQSPMEAPGAESVRMLGDNWIIAEARSTMMDVPYNGILSLGYDSQKEHFVGTWIDSFGGYLWIYKGTLNDTGDTLTLETEGPSLYHPSETARYREIIRITGEDTRTFTSTTETDDGEWTKILTIEYRRKE